MYFILEIVVRINHVKACETMPSKRDLWLIDAIF